MILKEEGHRPPYEQLSITYCLKWFNCSDAKHEHFIDCDADTLTYSRKFNFVEENSK